MTQDEADKELGRIVRESLIKVVGHPGYCEIDVVLVVEGRGPVMARIRVSHADGCR
jgi:hypothetical protein